MRRIIVLVLLILDILCMAVCTVSAWRIREAALTEVSVGAVRSGMINGVFYRTTVPSGAVLRDENGPFVYILVKKETSIGTRYYAERIDAGVLAEDGKTGVTALSAPVASGDTVILSPGKDLSTGMQVRIPEEGRGREGTGR